MGPDLIRSLGGCSQNGFLFLPLGSENRNFPFFLFFFILNGQVWENLFQTMAARWNEFWGQYDKKIDPPLLPCFGYRYFFLSPVLAQLMFFSRKNSGLT